MPLRKLWLVRSVSRDGHGRFGDTRLRVLGCASRPSRFGFRQVRREPICAGIHRHLTIRSSRPHVVASAMCFTLRLHTSAAPPRVGLTQALGGEKLSVVVPSAPTIHWLRLAVLFGEIAGALPLRPSPQGALTPRMRYVHRLRNLRFLSFGLSAPHAVTSDRSS